MKRKLIKPGDRYNRLVIQTELPKKSSKRRFECLCDCGETTITSLSSLSQGQIGCRCYQKEITSKRTWKGYGDLSGDLFYKIKYGAMSRNLDFEISIEDGWNLFLTQDKKCALSGLDIILIRDNREKEQTASLDRIDSSKGYHLDNIQWIHKDLNCMKSSYSQSYFIDMCSAICIYNQTGKCVSKLEYNDTKRTEITQSLFYAAGYGAKTRNLIFDVTIEDVKAKFKKQGGKCALTGMVLDFNSKRNNCDGTASLDRIDSSRGYTLDNIRFIHKHINKSKMDYSDEYFLRLCKTVYEKNNGVL